MVLFTCNSRAGYRREPTAHNRCRLDIGLVSRLPQHPGSSSIVIIIIGDDHSQLIFLMTHYCCRPDIDLVSCLPQHPGIWNHICNQCPRVSTATCQWSSGKSLQKCYFPLLKENIAYLRLKLPSPKKSSWPIYVNVDSPNLGFPYFYFLGGYQ